jgi:hypothetical protein
VLAQIKAGLRSRARSTKRQPGLCNGPGLLKSSSLTAIRDPSVDRKDHSTAASNDRS